MLRLWFVLLLLPTLALAGTFPATPDPTLSAQQRWGSAAAGYVVSGCLHSTSATTSVSVPSCRAFARETAAAAALKGFEEPVARPITYSAGDGTYWLAGRANPSVTPGGWTCVAGTHYCWVLSATAPTIPNGLLVLLQSTVSAAAITLVTPMAAGSPGPAIDARLHLAADGVTDDQPALTTLLTRAQGREIRLPRGTIKLGGPSMTMTNTDVTLVGEGIDQTVLDITSFTGTLVLTGTLTDRTTTVGVITPVNRAFVVASAAGIAQFDWLFLSDEATQWNASRPLPTYAQGEWVQAMAIAGTTITSSHQAYDTYASGIKVWHLSRPIQVKLKGLTIRANFDGRAVRIQHALHTEIQDVKIYGARLSSLKIQHAVGTRIRNLHTYDNWFVGTSQSYGLEVGIVHDLIVTDSYLQGGRHAFTTTGTGSFGPPDGGVNRHVTVTDSYLATHKEEEIGTTENFALDLHGNSEFIIFANNHVEGGIQLAGDHLTVMGNTVTSEPNAPVAGLLKFREMKGLNVNISHNRFTMTRATGGDIAIELGTSANSASLDRGGSNFIFSHNQLFWNNIDNGNWCLINLIPQNGIPQNSVKFTDNQFHFAPSQSATSVTTQGECRLFSTGTGTIVRTIEMARNHLTRGQLRIDTAVDNLFVTENSIAEAHGNGITITTTSALGLKRAAHVSRNTVFESNGHGISILGEGSTVGVVHVFGNITYNNGQDATLGGTLRTGININNVDVAHVIDNTSYDDQGTATQQYGILTGSGVGSTQAALNLAYTNGTTDLLFNTAGAELANVLSTPLQNNTVAFSALGTPAAGTQVVCTNCVVTSGANNTCAGGVGVALAVYLDSVWRCFALQN